jgi:aminocarboxymuconate-semialdehyde decarboxylase
MIIDWHTHLYPPEETEKPYWNGRCQMTLDNVLRAQDEAGIDATVVSNPGNYWAKLPAEDALAVVERQNRYYAEMQERHPGRIFGIAGCNPYAGEDYLRELERAVTQDGLKGVCINSSFKGHYPDDKEAMPFFELATRLDIPVMMHPPFSAYGEERMRDFRLTSSVGRPFDSCLALARLILYGVFERFPNLKFLATHLGGGISEVLGRLDYNYELQAGDFYARDKDREALPISHPPSHYMRRVYLDSVSYYAPAARCAMETVGVEHFVFGTDAPPLTPLKQRGLALIDELGLSPADKEKVLSGNAKRLLKLS